MSEWKSAVRDELIRFNARQGDRELTRQELLNQSQHRLESQFPNAATPGQTLSRVLQELAADEIITMRGEGVYRIQENALDTSTVPQVLSTQQREIVEQWKQVIETHSSGHHFDTTNYQPEQARKDARRFISTPTYETFDSLWSHLFSARQAGSPKRIYDKWTDKYGRTPQELADLIETILNADGYDSSWEDELGAKSTLWELFGLLHIETHPILNGSARHGLQLFGYPDASTYEEGRLYFEDFKLDYEQIGGQGSQGTAHEVPVNLEIDQLLNIIDKINPSAADRDDPADIQTLNEHILAVRDGGLPTRLATVLEEILDKYVAPNEMGTTDAERSVKNFPQIQTLFKEHAIEALTETLPEDRRFQLIVRKGYGAGTLAHIPHLSVFDLRQPDSTQTGVYIVFLFDPITESVFLTLNQGATEAAEVWRRANLPSPQTDVLEAHARLYREYVTVDDTWVFDFAPLSSELNNSDEYSKGTICYKEYSKAELSKADVTQDVHDLLGAYSGLLDTIAEYLPIDLEDRSVWQAIANEESEWLTWKQEGKVSISRQPETAAENHQSAFESGGDLTELSQGDIIVALRDDTRYDDVYGIGIVTEVTDSTDKNAQERVIKTGSSTEVSVEWFSVADEALPVTPPYEGDLFSDATFGLVPESGFKSLLGSLCFRLSAIGDYNSPSEAADTLIEVLEVTSKKRDGEPVTEAPISEPAPFYWVNQSDNGTPIAGEYIEAELDDNWYRDLRKLDIGDQIFNYHAGEILGYSTVTREAYYHSKPDGQYHRVDVEFTPFDQPLQFPEIFPTLVQDEYRLDKYNAIKDTGINQKYLMCLSQEAGEYLLAEGSNQANIERLEDRLDLPTLSVGLPENLYFPPKQAEQLQRQLTAALNSGKNLIFTGPPGTGKTKLATTICEQLVADGTIDDSVFTTATAEWTAYDTVGGYMISRNGNSDVLEFSPGQFLRCFRDTANNNIHTQWLVIDELNRSDIDKAFGQLFSVLSGDSVELPYERDGPVSIEWVDESTPESERNAIATNADRFPVTPAWRLLGTMNTADKASLYEMSYAFMRRFNFVHVGIPQLTDDDGRVKTWLLDPNYSDENYAAAWTDNTDVTAALSSVHENIAVLWANINDTRPIGPALVHDIASYVGAYIAGADSIDQSLRKDALTNAIISLVFPQFEGIRPGKQKELIMSLNAPRHVTHAPETSLDDDEDDPTQHAPGVNVEHLKQTAEDMFAITFDDGEDES